MFEYFRDNYVWNLSVNLALAMGASMGEIETACKPILDAASRGEDAGTEQFFSSWMKVGDQLVRLAEADEKKGRLLSAGEKYGRAAVYYITAERMQSRHYAPRKKLYAHMLDCFSKYMSLTRQPSERVEIPYGKASIAGYFWRPDGSPKNAPCMIFVNGLDSTKEMIYRAGFARALARRGIATLIVDQPGAGEALRLHGLTAVIEAERWVAPIVDFLQSRPGVDPDRIGLMGWSLAGFFVPRATAFEPRLKCFATLGANHDWGEVQTKRRAREGENPVPHYWDHVMWVWGHSDIDEFMTFARDINLDGILDRIKVPALVIHGGNDRQISLSYAHKTYEALVNSPKRELKITTAEDGGVEHCSADAMDNVRDYMADWIAETLGGHTK